MKTGRIVFLFSLLLSMVGTNAFAYAIEVKNADGITIRYNYFNDGKELEVAGCTSGDNLVLVIPEEVTYMNRTRKVTSIHSTAFSHSWGLISVTIPNSVTSIGDGAFEYCQSLASVTIPNSVTSIESGTFKYCSALTSITIPNSVTSIGEESFFGCSSLTSVTIPNSVTSIGQSAFYDCGSLASVTIPNSVTSIGEKAFIFCRSLTSVTIPNSLTSIEEGTFEQCSSLVSVTIPNSVTSIGKLAFNGCKLTSVTIPNSVTSIGQWAFSGNDMTEVISQIENPNRIDLGTFTNNTFLNATLYVPKGTIDKYKETEGWNKFAFIEEGSGKTSGTKKCEKPTISYHNGKLRFYSATEGAVFHSTITDTDINSYNTNEVQLCVTYNITIYATKNGYENSETATATLCWIDVEPKTEGITNNVANVRAMAVMIHNEGGQLIVNGIDDGTQISVFNTNGVQEGSSISRNGSAVINTNLHAGSVAIVKIGERAIKVVLK